jgi:hypothetical protein
VPEQLIRGREDIYFGYEFATRPGRSFPTTWSTTTSVSSPIPNPNSLRGSLEFYRAWDATVAQNMQRATRPLTMPVLAIGGAASWGELVGDERRVRSGAYAPATCRRRVRSLG